MSFETPLPPYNSTDPYATFLNASCLDLLLIEMVPAAYRITDELSRRDLAHGLVDTRQGQGQGMVKSSGYTDGGMGTGMGTEIEGKEGDDGEGGGSRRREGAYRRLEGLGYRVGQGIVER